MPKRHRKLIRTDIGELTEYDQSDPLSPDGSPAGWWFAREWMPWTANPNVLRLSRLHSKYPEHLQEKRFRQVSKLLDQEPSVVDAIVQLEGIRDQVIAQSAGWSERTVERMRHEVTRSHAEGIPLAEGQRASMAWKAYLDEMNVIGSALSSVYAAILVEAERLASELEPTAREIRVYLDNRVMAQLPFQQAPPDRWLEPFQLIVNRGNTPFPTELGPGQVGLTFTNLATRDLTPELGPIISEALMLASGVEPMRGGRPTRRDDLEKASIAQIAARLYHWEDWTQSKIAMFLGWAGDEKSVRERVRRAVRDGERLLIRECGADWDMQLPRGLEEAHDRNDR